MSSQKILLVVDGLSVSAHYDDNDIKTTVNNSDCTAETLLVPFEVIKGYQTDEEAFVEKCGKYATGVCNHRTGEVLSFFTEKEFGKEVEKLGYRSFLSLTQ